VPHPDRQVAGQPAPLPVAPVVGLVNRVAAAAVRVGALGQDLRAGRRKPAQRAQEGGRRGRAAEQAEVVAPQHERVVPAAVLGDRADERLAQPARPAHLDRTGRDVQRGHGDPALLQGERDPAGAGAHVEHAAPAPVQHRAVSFGPRVRAAEVAVGRCRADESVVALDDLHHPDRVAAAEHGAGTAPRHGGKGGLEHLAESVPDDRLRVDPQRRWSAT
jgi:hypothetical protein